MSAGVIASHYAGSGGGGPSGPIPRGTPITSVTTFASGATPDKLIDGNPSTWCQSQGNLGPGAYFGVDLGAAYHITDLVMSQIGFPTWTIEHSIDNASWTPILLGQTDDITLQGLNITARYIRVTFTGNPNGGWWYVGEIGPFDDVARSTPPRGVPWLEGSTVVYGYGADDLYRVVDGSDSTYYTSNDNQKPTSAVGIDLGVAYTITQVALIASFSSWVLESSNDKATWTQRATGSGNSTIAVPSVTARYWRVRCTVTTGDWWNMAKFALS